MYKLRQLTHKLNITKMTSLTSYEDFQFET